MAGVCATKFAVLGFSGSLFKEVRPDGIRVTCIMPGSVETHFNGNEPGAEPNPHKMQPEDIAAMVGFFASDRAGYITGQTISVSGGLTMV